MVRRLRAVPVPLVLVVLIGLAGIALGRIYAGPLLAQLVLGAAVASVAVSVATRRRAAWLVAPLSVLALAAYTVAALRLAAIRAAVPGGLDDVLIDSARNGIPRLITAMIPVEPLPDTVVVPVTAAWLAGLAGAELALRSRRVLLGYAPPALLYAGVLYVVGPNAAPAVWPTLAFAAVAAVGLAFTGRPSEPVGPAAAELAAPVRAAQRARTATGALAGVAAVVALTMLVAPVVAGRVGTTPVDPRRYVEPPQLDSLDENPLIRISGWALNPDQHLFDVTTRTSSGGAPAGPPDGGDGERPANASGLRIRLAVLPDYDGVTWRVGATYRNAGRVLPAAQLRPDTQVDTVHQEITVADLTGRLLPAVPTPEEVDGARVAYDPGTGTLMRPDGLTAGLRYTVTSARERPDLNLLPVANVPSGEAVARVLRVGEGVPEQLQRLTDQLAADNGAPYQRASAIEQFLAEHYRLVADAPSGHAYPNLNFFLFGPLKAGGQRGTSEQFAASFAVLGRLMGLPTRVVVGFNSPTGNGPVRGADAYAWPEVLFDELGWVAFDPLPQPNTDPRPVEEDFKPKPDQPTPPPTEAPQPTATPTTAPSPTTAAASGGHGGSGALLVAGGAAGALVSLVAGFAVVVIALRRTQRRRRLDEGPPAQRIVGAWLEVTDALRLAGQPVAAHLAATEIAAHARSVAALAGATDPRPSTPPIDDLAALVNLTAFAPGIVEEEQARQAGADAVAYAERLRADRPWWRRVVWALHPGPLRWRR